MTYHLSLHICASLLGHHNTSLGALVAPSRDYYCGSSHYFARCVFAPNSAPQTKMLVSLKHHFPLVKNLQRSVLLCSWYASTSVKIWFYFALPCYLPMEFQSNSAFHQLAHSSIHCPQFFSTVSVCPICLQGPTYIASLVQILPICLGSVQVSSNPYSIPSSFWSSTTLPSLTALQL